jgi:hypothetical protein
MVEVGDLAIIRSRSIDIVTYIKQDDFFYEDVVVVLKTKPHKCGKYECKQEMAKVLNTETMKTFWIRADALDEIVYAETDDYGHYLDLGTYLVEEVFEE